MARNTDPLRRVRRGEGPSPATLALRALTPAAYGAALLGGLFAPDHGLRPAAVAVLAGFIGYFLWRIHALLARSTAPDLERAEVGLLAALALSTALEAAAAPPVWSLTAHAVLLVGLAASVSFPAILVLPLAAVPVWRNALPALIHLELVAGAAGLTFLLEKRRHRRLQLALDKLRLDQEHLDGQPEAGSAKRDLSHLDDLLYNYLQQVKEHTDAHGAVLVVLSPRGELFVRELVSESHDVQEDRVLNLEGTAFQWVLENRKPLSVGRLRDATARLGYYGGGVAVKSFLGVPVLEGDQAQGILAVDHLREDAFTEAHATVLKVAAHQVSTILSQLRELEQWKRRSNDFQHLHDFSKSLVVCRTAPEVLTLFLATVQTRVKPDLSALALLEGGQVLRFAAVNGPRWAELEGREFSPADGLAGWVLESGHYLHYDAPRDGARRPLFSRDIRVPDFGSLILQPLRASTDTIGVFCAASLSAKAFDPAAVQFCEVLAQHGAQGISLLRAHEELERLATTDGLTDLANRRVFFDRLGAEILRSRRYEHGLALLILDADHFKKINDLHGHPAGDAVLRAVAQALAAFARETDLPARYGGEEFAILLPSTTEEGARALAERVRAGVEALQVAWEGKVIPVRVSVGVATLEGESDSADGLVARADQALYAAKQTGRNKVVTHSEIREYASWK
ncbi:MAG: GGDEF domain-containing protein [Proteobacteria bacterium]|nr:GGDEF domain-containing protein [Pseudomonadota bacterium]